MGAPPPHVRHRRRLTRLVLGGVAALSTVLPASSGRAAEADAPIDPGRPELVSGAGTVAPGRVQIESGVKYEHTSPASGRADRRLAFEATLRTGITEDIEVRLGGEPLVALRGAERATGAGNVTLGLKYRIFRGRDGLPALGVLPSVTLPTADRPIGRERTDVGLVGLAGFDLPWELDLDVNVGVEVLGQRRPSGFLAAGLMGAALSRDLTRDVGAFVETRLASREERRGRVRLQAGAGVVWRLTRSLAVDVAGHAGAGDAPDYTLRAGLSVRLPR